MEKFWSDVEVEFLKTWYPHFGGQYIADNLNIPLCKVRNKCNKLKLKMFPRVDRLCSDCKVIKLNPDAKKQGLRCSKCFYIHRQKVRIRQGKSLKSRFSEMLRSIRYRTPDSEIDALYLMRLYDYQGGRCAYSNKEMTIANWGSTKNNMGNRDSRSISIDRIDSSLGYLKGNVVLVCWIVNVGKNMYSLEEYKDICRDVYENDTILDIEFLKGI